jgi:hypothetical protein
VLDQFDRMDKAAKAASLQLDKNDVSFSAFGEQRVTTGFYQAFQVKLARLDEADPDGMDACIFSMELPKEYAAALGESSLRLVAPVGARSQSRGVRLLLVNLQGQVTDTLELRPPGNRSGALQIAVSH